MSNLRNPIGWIPFTEAWRTHKANIRRVLAVMRGLLQEVHDRWALLHLLISATLIFLDSRFGKSDSPAERTCGCRGPPSPEDESIAAHLMRVHDKAGNPLPHARQWSELSIFFYAGVRLGPSNDLP